MDGKSFSKTLRYSLCQQSYKLSTFHTNILVSFFEKVFRCPGKNYLLRFKAFFAALQLEMGFLDD